MGYEPQPRQTSADFLVAVTDPKGRFVREGFEDRVPKSADDFVRHWRQSGHYKRLVDEVDRRLQEHDSEQGQQRIEHFRESARADIVKRQSDKSSFLISYPMMVRLAMRRRFQMQMGDIATLAIVSIAALFQALIIGSVYFQMPKDTSGFFSRGGVMSVKLVLPRRWRLRPSPAPMALEEAFERRLEVPHPAKLALTFCASLQLVRVT